MSLKLVLLDTIIRLDQKLLGGLFGEIFRIPKRDGPLMGFKLPQLGALLVAKDEKGGAVLLDEKGAVLDEKRRAVLLQSSAEYKIVYLSISEYKALLKKYSELPHDGIALIVANAFMAERQELDTYEREAEAEHHELDTYNRRSKLGAVFNLCAC